MTFGHGSCAGGKTHLCGSMGHYVVTGVESADYFGTFAVGSTKLYFHAAELAFVDLDIDEIEALCFGQCAVGHGDDALADGTFKVDFGKTAADDVALVVEFKNYGYELFVACGCRSLRHDAAAKGCDGVDALGIVGHAEVGGSDAGEHGVVALGHIGAELKAAALRDGSKGLASGYIIARTYEHVFHITANGGGKGTRLRSVAQTARRGCSSFVTTLGVLKFTLGDDFLFGEFLCPLVVVFGSAKFALRCSGGIAVGHGLGVDGEEALTSGYGHSFGKGFAGKVNNACHGGSDGGFAAAGGQHAAAHADYLGKVGRTDALYRHLSGTELGIGHFYHVGAVFVGLVVFAFAVVGVGMVVMQRMACAKEHDRKGGHDKFQ